jgi:type II secretory pathway pseudopilin PulG
MRKNRRVGFTVIELLVVIAIIGTLIGLLIPAVMKARMSAYRTNTVIEITQLDAACKAFYAKYSFYPPSRITLPPTSSADIAILKRMFPRCTPSSVSWGVTGSLSGDECLVFFLGGINQQGFGQDPTNPANFANGKDAPFFNFQSVRIVPGSNGHPAYQDYFRTNVYAFFSSTNGYASDCPSLMSSGPYLSGPSQFIKPDSVQILSAGENRAFGPGGSVLTPGAGSGLPPAAKDDLANFSGGVLGGF